MGRIYSLLPLIVLFLFLGAGIVQFQKDEEKGSQEKDSATQLLIGDVIFDVEIVDTPETRQQGLSDREGLAPKTGMLFVFQEPDFHGIWMKDMQFPIDIIWLDGELIVVDTAPNISPDSFPTIFYPSAPASYVLEVGAGVVERYGMRIGAKTRLAVSRTIDK